MQGSVCLSVGEGSEALLPDKARQKLLLEGDCPLLCIPVVCERPDVKNRGCTLPPATEITLLQCARETFSCINGPTVASRVQNLIIGSLFIKLKVGNQIDSSTPLRKLKNLLHFSENKMYLFHKSYKQGIFFFFFNFWSSLKVVQKDTIIEPIFKRYSQFKSESFETIVLQALMNLTFRTGL